jgi:hypothetical protein
MLCNDHSMSYNMWCYIMYVSVIEHPWCYITSPNGYVTCYITCYRTCYKNIVIITLFLTCAFQSHYHYQLVHAPPCAASASPLPIVQHPLYIPYSSAQRWPLSYCHIQQLSLYSLLLLPLPALVLATVPSQLPNQWGRVSRLFPATKPCIIGT